MGERRKSREVLLQLLFQAEVNAPNTEKFLEHFPQAPEVSGRSERLFVEIWEKRKALDYTIEEASQNWKVSRMSLVDRNILRLACYELLYCKDVPMEVVFDEAIEIAKRYGTEDSPSFVNGILDKVRKSQPL
ncbi:MAG: transcription antitermination factor NusB [Deltaproteobacteria bacterium]|nr:transcription antitermination factor NusB [Deltaproteobacteria bacterium]MBI3016628.1 transcription antitermination factor NusB [Deltaproteobacteria bacterium]